MSQLLLRELGRLGDMLGRGGQAVVYAVPELTLPDVPGPLVFKQYKRSQAIPYGLPAIVGIRNRLGQRTREKLDSVSAWPVRTVVDDSVVRGVVMPRIPDSYYQERILPGSGTWSRDPREAQNLFVDPVLAIRLGMPEADFDNRLAVCHDLAFALDLLHANDIVFGDLNARNVLYRLTSTPTVMLVDCDAVRIRGAASVVRQLNAPDWNPPEPALAINTDLYKLGLFVLRTLTPGPQASISRDPERAADILDANGMRLLRAALSEPATRPPAAAWLGYFRHRLALSRRRVDDPAPSTTPSNWLSSRNTTVSWVREPGTGNWEPAT